MRWFVLVATVIATPLVAAPVTTERLLSAGQDANNWLTYGRDYAETRYSPLKQIDRNTVGQLGLAWSHEFDDKQGLEATPLVIDGVIYVSGTWSRVYALDAVSGKLLWEYDPKVPKKYLVRACCGPVNRGVAAYGDSIFVGTLEGYLVSINRHTGREEWRTLTVDPEKDYAITGAPRVVKDMVLIGNGGAEYGVRGYLSAYDAKTGKQRWRFYTVPGNPADGFENDAMAMAAKTWNGEWWKYGGGGTVWDSFVYDPELNLVYIGVSNGGPWNQQIRSPGGGDNLFLSSIVAVNADTGDYVWHYQETPEDNWDYTATQQITLLDLEWKGQLRKVLVQAPKNGFFFVIDRVTGEFLSAVPFTKVKWADGYDEKGRPIIKEEAKYREKEFMMMPSAIGGHNWHPMSYSVDTGLVYIPATRAMMPFKQPENLVWYPHHQNPGVDVPGQALISPLFMQMLKNKLIRGELIAWNPQTQKAEWTYKHQRAWNGGTLATAGGLVFQGTATNEMMAFDAKSGEVLWNYPTRIGIIAAPVSYAVNGEQYIAVMAKWGGAGALALGLEPEPDLGNGRLLVFKLGGKTTLPELPVANTERYEPPAMTLTDEASLKEGEKLFTELCSICHGRDAVSGGNVPDLRRPVMPYDAFKAIVLDGALQERGMANFSDVLDEQKLQKIHSYVIRESRADYEEYQRLKEPGLINRLRLWWYDKLSNLVAWLADRA